MFLVLSAFTAYLFFVGWLLTSYAVTRGELLDRVGLSLSAGLLANLCLMLTGQTMPIVFGVGGVLAAAGVVVCVRDVRRGTGLRGVGTAGMAWSLVIIAYLLAAYYFYILSEPLIRWDARSIWFFHARMIWLDRGIRLTGRWNEPSIAFSHPDYPPLGPILGAQLSYLAGYWNEFAPKASLLVLMAPPLFWLFTFRRAGASFVLVLLALTLSLDGWLSNGMMDGYLVLYAGAAMLLWGRYLAEPRDVDLYAALCATGVAASLKQEGLLFALCLAVVLCFGPGAVQFGPARLAVRARTDRRFLGVLSLAAAPAVMWMIVRQWLGVHSEYVSGGALSRIVARAEDPASMRYLVDWLGVRANDVWLVVLVVAAAAAFVVAVRRQALHRGALVAAATAGLYTVGLALVYLSTPYDFRWHIASSATRTMATSTAALVAAAYFLLSSIEAQPEQTGREAISTSTPARSRPA